MQSGDFFHRLTGIGGHDGHPTNIVIAVISLVGTAFVGACGLLGPAGEEVREQPSKTVYRSTDEIETELPNVAPAQKVPGE